MFSFKKILYGVPIGILRQDHSINEKEFMQIYKISEKLSSFTKNVLAFK